MCLWKRQRERKRQMLYISMKTVISCFSSGKKAPHTVPVFPYSFSKQSTTIIKLCSWCVAHGWNFTLHRSHQTLSLMIKVMKLSRRQMMVHLAICLLQHLDSVARLINKNDLFTVTVLYQYVWKNWRKKCCLLVEFFSNLENASLYSFVLFIYIGLAV